MSKNLMPLWTGLFLILLIVSCDKFEEIIPKETIDPDYKTYLIKEGQHSSTNSYTKINSSSVKFKTIFDSSAIYQTTDNSNQGDINKLYGLSDCNGHHHENSVRFGWRWMNDQLEIHAYTYAQGERSSKYITSVALDKEYTYHIQRIGEQYILTVGDISVSMNRGCSENNSGYKLFPYFGGDETAPHDITIGIKEIEVD